MKRRTFGAFCLATLLFSTPYAIKPLLAQGLRVEPDVSIDWMMLDALIPRRSIAEPPPPEEILEEITKEITEPAPVEPVQIENQLAELEPEETAQEEPEPEQPALEETTPEEPAQEEPELEEAEPEEVELEEPALEETTPEEITSEEPEAEEPTPEEPEAEEPAPETIRSKYPQLAELPPYIIFSGDQLVLAQAHRRALDPFADLLKEQKSLRLRLHSLADDRTETYQKMPSSTSGKVLRAAVSRARSVENYLVERGIDEARIEIMTTEQSGPAAHQNRVEFEFHD